MFNLSPIYSAHKSLNYKISPNHKISPDTNPHKTKKYTNTKHKIFEELVPLVSPLYKKKHIRLGHVGIVGQSVDVSRPD